MIRCIAAISHAIDDDIDAELYAIALSHDIVPARLPSTPPIPAIR
jgi:hypothetical protein